MGETLKPIPTFQREAEERSFWETHDSSDYVDWSRAKRVRFPNLGTACLDETASASVPASEPRSNSSASTLPQGLSSIDGRTDR